jgi:hypothetical protein
MKAVLALRSNEQFFMELTFAQARELQKKAPDHLAFLFDINGQQLEVNYQKCYVDWFLHREGNLVYQEITEKYFQDKYSEIKREIAIRQKNQTEFISFSTAVSQILRRRMSLDNYELLIGDDTNVKTYRLDNLGGDEFTRLIMVGYEKELLAKK